MKCEDIYIRVSDPSGKHPDIVSWHRVWDRQKFLQATTTMHANQAKPADVRTVQITSEAEYRQYKGYKV